MSKEITNKLYRPLSMYFHPGKDGELEVVSKTHGKFIATSNIHLVIGEIFYVGLM